MPAVFLIKRFDTSQAPLKERFVVDARYKGDAFFIHQIT